MVDHVIPGAAGGAWLAGDNLVTACNPCNSIKADLTLHQLGWELRPVASDEWDGLTRFYFQLWRAAGSPRPDYHGAWMRDLGIGFEEFVRPRD
jgi:HNH endonuclease